jgi:hypothetical protein
VRNHRPPFLPNSTRSELLLPVYRKSLQPAALPCLVPRDADPSKTAPPLAGMNGLELTVGLDDQQIAALCAHVRSSWRDRAAPVDATDVAIQH